MEMVRTFWQCRVRKSHSKPACFPVKQVWQNDSQMYIPVSVLVGPFRRTLLFLVFGDIDIFEDFGKIFQHGLHILVICGHRTMKL